MNVEGISSNTILLKAKPPIEESFMLYNRRLCFVVLACANF